LYAEWIRKHLRAKREELAAFWEGSRPVKHFIVDDLLPESLALEIAREFPARESLKHLRSLRESKRVGTDMDAYHPSLSEITFAFQDRGVLAEVEQITGITELNADERLYSSGISSMGNGDFLQPHIDNSGNPFLKQYRRVNALYYVSPGWRPGLGGELELWDGKRANPLALEPRFNRVIFMNTNRTSFHSVRPLACGKDFARNCVSNYYFSPLSPEGYEYSHVTSFRGRPENPVADALLRLDGSIRNALRKLKPRKPEEIKHVYRKGEG